MIDPAGIPQISGDMAALARHAADLTSVGTGFADTGSRVHSTWQGLAVHYDAPEAAQLFAATSPIPSVTASVGEDLGAVGSALAGYAAEVEAVQAQLTLLRSQAAEFVATTAVNPDWRDNAADVDRHNQLLGAVNAAVAQFQDAERRCANAILALYTDRRYVVDNGDGVLDPGEHGYTREVLDAALAGEGLAWGSAEQVDRGLLGDIGAFFGGAGEALWGAVTGLGALVGLGPDGFSWETAGAAWAGLGTFALAVSPVGWANAFVDLPGLPQGTLPGVLGDAGKALIAYDTWGQDPARAAGMATANIITAVIGTKGAGAALRGAGAVASTSRVGVIAAAGGGALRVGEAIGRLPSVADLNAGVLARLRGLDIPPVDLPPIDLPPTHVDPPRVDVPPAPTAGPSIADGVAGTDAPRPDAPAAPPAAAADAAPPPDASPQTAAPDAGDRGNGPGTATAAGDPPAPIDPDAPRADRPVGTATAAGEAPPPPDGGRPDADPGSGAGAADRQPVAVGAGSAEAAPARPAEALPGSGAGQFDLAGDRTPEGITASAADPAGDRAAGGPAPVDGSTGARPAGGDDARPVDATRETDRPAGPPPGGGPGSPGTGGPDTGGGTPPDQPADRPATEPGTGTPGSPDPADGGPEAGTGAPGGPQDPTASDAPDPDAPDPDAPDPDAPPPDAPPSSVADGPEKARLIEQLQASGTKVDPDSVVRIGVDPNGRTVWIEEGGVNPRTGRSSGLQHVIDEHGGQFNQHGIATADIPEVVQRAATEGRYTGYLQGAPPGRPIFEIEFNGQTHYIAVSVGNNGYIVGAGMRSADTPFAGAKPDPRFADDPTFRGW